MLGHESLYDTTRGRNEQIQKVQLVCSLLSLQLFRADQYLGACTVAPTVAPGFLFLTQNEHRSHDAGSRSLLQRM